MKALYLYGGDVPHIPHILTHLINNKHIVNPQIIMQCQCTFLRHGTYMHGHVVVMPVLKKRASFSCLMELPMRTQQTFIVFRE